MLEIESLALATSQTTPAWPKIAQAVLGQTSA
jgi:hypothetical protein